MAVEDTQFKPGELWKGNKNGRPKGSKSLKTYVREMLQDMNDEEKLEFLQGIDKKTLWEMSEGKPKQDVEHGGVVTISHVLDSLENERSETLGQGMEDQPSLQDQEQATTTGNL